MLSHLMEVIAGRQNAVGTDESLNLKQQRTEGRPEDESEGAQEKPARPEMAGSVARPRSKEPLRSGKRSGAHRSILFLGVGKAHNRDQGPVSHARIEYANNFPLRSNSKVTDTSFR